MTDHANIGSSLDDFLEEEGIFAEVSAIALKRVLAWQIAREMEQRGLSKAEMAEAMNTSRSSLDRLLDPENVSITLKTMDRAAAALGKRLQIELVETEPRQASVT